MSELPILPLWVNKYDGKTGHLSLEEDGAYMRLLRLCWKTPGCRIPADGKWVQRMMRVDEATYERVVKPILEEFFERKQGYWQSLRLLDEYERAWNMKRARAEAGSKGGKAKALKDKDEEPSKATILPEQTPSKNVAIHIPSPSHLHVEEKEEPKGSSKKKEEGSSKGTRLPEDWDLPEEWFKETYQFRLPSGDYLTEQEIFYERDRFRDYWHSQPGGKGRKLNWHATWRNWIRTGAPQIIRQRDASGHRAAGRPGKHERFSFTDALIERGRARRERDAMENKPADGGADVVSGSASGEIVLFRSATPF